MGEIRGVAVASSKEIEEEDAAPLFHEGRGEAGQGEARGCDAVEEEDLPAVLGAEFIDSYGAVL